MQRHKTIDIPIYRYHIGRLFSTILFSAGFLVPLANSRRQIRVLLATYLAAQVYITTLVKPKSHAVGGNDLSRLIRRTEKKIVVNLR